MKASEIREILWDLMVKVGDVEVEVMTLNEERGVVSFQGVVGWRLECPEVHGDRTPDPTIQLYGPKD
jgi:hypothetical protein